jgi:hypothetical protein
MFQLSRLLSVFLKDKKGWWKEECMFHPHACCVTKTTQAHMSKAPSMILMWCYIKYGDLVPCLFVGILGKVDLQMVFASRSIAETLWVQNIVKACAIVELELKTLLDLNMWLHCSISRLEQYPSTTTIKWHF